MIEVPSRSKSLCLQIGLSVFELRGLNESQELIVKEAWGPFVLSMSLESGNEPSLKAERCRIDFYLGPPPPDQEFCYQRADDLWLCDRSDEANLMSLISWTDGSLGAIEASVQVLLQWSVQARGGLLVHASAGVYQGKGVIVPGASNAGKSTIAREAGFDLVLSDEMVVIEPIIEGLGYQLHSTPFWSEGRQFPLIVTQAPLYLLAFPHKSDKAELLDCSEAEAVRSLLRGVTLYERAPLLERREAQRELFLIACQLCTQVKAARLYFPKTGPWLGKLTEAFT